MNAERERLLLQICTGFACLVPLSMGIHSILEGPEVLRGVAEPLPIDLDSHFRYLSGLLLGTGIAFLLSIRRIEERGAVFRALGLIIFIGGLARLLSLLQQGFPGPGHRFGLMMELVVVPLIVVWQARIARRCRSRR